MDPENHKVPFPKWRKCYKMRQRSVPETPKEETTLMSFQVKFKNSWIWPNNTETQKLWGPHCERVTNTQTQELIKKTLVIISFLTTSISRIHNVPIRVSLRPHSNVQVSFQSPDVGWADVIRHQPEALAWKEICDTESLFCQTLQRECS